MRHGEDCPRKGGWYVNPECHAFSMDGTALGADVAHLYGTMDDGEIRAIQLNEELNSRLQRMTGMQAE